MAGGITNDALVTSYETETAISYAGTVLTYGSAAGTTDVAGATDVVMGFAFATTKNRITGVAAADVKVGVIGAVNGLEIAVPLVSDNQVIAYGDPIGIDTAGAGHCNQRDGTTETGRRVGYAIEAVAVNTGGYVKIKVDVDSVDN